MTPELRVLRIHHVLTYGDHWVISWAACAPSGAAPTFFAFYLGLS